jgi:hypothetical protein
MLNIKQITLFFFIGFSHQFKSNAQENLISSVPKDYFINPLDIQLLLAGSFGEIRSNHFHSGLDIKTNQKEGYPVFAVADGFVSRLRVQIGGFGNAIYVNHPIGISSVYAHLQKFNPRITDMMRFRQYKEQSFAQDFLLTPIEIPVKKGDLIGWSGNSGSSAGPHLHFELRDTKTEETINPLLLGINIADAIKPTISGLYIYKINQLPFSEATPKQYFQTIGTNGNYKLNKIDFIIVSGEIGLGIMAYDQQNGTANKNGIFSTTIKLDDEIIFESIINQFAFEDSRAVNTFIDYPSKVASGRVIQKGFIAPNPKMKFYGQIKNRGLINLIDQNSHDLVYILRDYSGNESKLSFKIKSTAPATLSSILTAPKGQQMSYAKPNTFTNSEVKTTLPTGILYDDIDFKFSSTPKLPYASSKTYQIHNKLTPLHDAYELAIKPDSNSMAYADKMLVINLESGSQGGEFKDGFVKANPKVFGNFYLRIDSIAPTIVPVNIKEAANLSTQKSIQFRISDNLAGIESFNLFIDNEWVLAEYDLRNGKLWHTFDEKTGFGKHTLKLVVTDRKQNEKTYSINFYR